MELIPRPGAGAGPRGRRVTPAVEARDLFRVYSTPEGDAAALQGLNLAVREREVLVVLGPSGSGKTSLLRVLAALDSPSAGSVRVFGSDVAKLSGRRLADYRAHTLGYVDQHYSRALAPELSARELVALQLGLSGATRRERLAETDRLLERIGLTERRDARPDELSGGEQQRIAVCAALAHRPRLLLADEPTGELDAANAARVYELIGELAREQGSTTLVVSHDPESAAIADRIVRIRDGRVSEETVRDTGGDETIVVGRGGWLRLPEEMLVRAGIGTRARAELAGPSVVVTAVGQRAEANVAVQKAARESGKPVARQVVAQASSLRKTFGRGPAATTVFSGFGASFEARKLTVVTGPSGSGKTTLLHILAGLELPDEGEVVVAGTSVHPLGRAARAALRRAHIALVGQEPGLVPFLSARENVELAVALRNGDAADSSGRALDALGAVGLAERVDQRVSRLSAGERQRVAIARALAARPTLLLADEPTARLDQANALAVGILLAELARTSGAAVVCATHDPLVIEQADEHIAIRGDDRTVTP
jgi:ABC-type lipoprotein export system ATPase subunit